MWAAQFSLLATLANIVSLCWVASAIVYIEIVDTLIGELKWIERCDYYLCLGGLESSYNLFPLE